MKYYTESTTVETVRAEMRAAAFQVAASPGAEETVVEQYFAVKRALLENLGVIVLERLLESSTAGSATHELFGLFARQFPLVEEVEKPSQQLLDQTSLILMMTTGSHRTSRQLSQSPASILRRGSSSTTWVMRRTA